MKGRERVCRATLRFQPLSWRQELWRWAYNKRRQAKHIPQSCSDFGSDAWQAVLTFQLNQPKGGNFDMLYL